MPHNKFDVSSVDKIEDLPVFDVGCDSSAAWSKKYRHLSKSYTVDELLEEMVKLFPKYSSTYPDIVITGGEPMLEKFQPFWAELIEKSSKLFKDITFETNGTRVVSKKLKDAIVFGNKRLTFSVSPKLSLSGEPHKKTMNAAAISSMREIQTLTDAQVYLKFVVRDKEDIDEIRKFHEEYAYHWADETGGQLLNQPEMPIYLMPEGATIEGLELTEKRVAELAMSCGVRFSPRLHCHLFGNSWGS